MVLQAMICTQHTFATAPAPKRAANARMRTGMSWHVDLPTSV